MQSVRVVEYQCEGFDATPDAGALLVDMLTEHVDVRLHRRLEIFELLHVAHDDGPSLLDEIVGLALRSSELLVRLTFCVGHELGGFRARLGHRLLCGRVRVVDGGVGGLLGHEQDP